MMPSYKAEIVGVIVAHPEFCADEIAAIVGCHASTVRDTVGRLGIALPAKATRPIAKRPQGLTIRRQFRRFKYAGAE